MPSRKWLISRSRCGDKEDTFVMAYMTEDRKRLILCQQWSGTSLSLCEQPTVQFLVSWFPMLLGNNGTREKASGTVFPVVCLSRIMQALQRRCTAMGNKVLFTPFSALVAGVTKNRMEFTEYTSGGLANRLESFQQGGKRRGFTKLENVYSPEKGQTGAYLPTQKFKPLVNEDDELYVNGHGSREQTMVYANSRKSMDYLQVSIEDLIAQMQAHGLPEMTRAKIKLWICYSALCPVGGSESLAQAFSKKMFESGYELCFIYGYTAFTSSYDGAAREKHKTVKNPGDQPNQNGEYDGQNSWDLWASRYRRRYHNGVEVPEPPDMAIARMQARGVTTNISQQNFWKGTRSGVLQQNLGGINKRLP